MRPLLLNACCQPFNPVARSSLPVLRSTSSTATIMSKGGCSTTLRLPETALKTDGHLLNEHTRTTNSLSCCAQQALNHLPLMVHSQKNLSNLARIDCCWF